MKKFLYVLLLSCLFLFTSAARAQELGEVAFQQAMKDLGNDFRMMCLAAHPDDEDGATLAYYRMLHGVKTFAVIATRGEGGQNEIGPELYNELGVIRTREMKAAAAIEGAELHFLDLPEFGFSKTAEETLATWGKEVALERMVRKIREIRPHVIITHHGRMKDHGHHQAIGAILIEAFDVSADGTRFPELGLEPWQASRLYIRDFRGGEGTVPTNIAALEPLRGQTIAEIAASALRVHESQGMKQFIDLLLSSQHRSYYNLVKTKGEAKTTGQAAGASYGALFDGLPLPAEPLAIAGATKAEIRAALYTWLKENAALRDGAPDERERWAEANRAAIIASELRLTATPKDSRVTHGQEVSLAVSLADHGAPDAIVADVELRHHHGLGQIGNHRLQIPFQTAREGGGTFTFKLPTEAALTLPHAPRLFEPTFLAPQLEVTARVNCGDATLELSAPVYLDVADSIAIEFPTAPRLVRVGSVEPVAVDVLVTNNDPEARSEYISLSPPEGWQVVPARMSVSLDKESAMRTVTFTLTPPEGLAAGEYGALVQVPGSSNQVALTLRAVEVQLAEGRRTGLIQGYDRTFSNILTQLGAPFGLIGPNDYRAEVLDTFDTLIVDIRAYQYRPDLAANNGALLDYVQRGGTAIVMYQKTFDWNPDFAPYPITLSNNRVTREDAPVTLLAPEHPLLTMPNAIQPGDWDGWIQERGLYFPEQWGEQFTPLVQTADPGEDIPPGSYLVAAHGDGHYIYTALSWYRQLRELHPGALRCFANMLAYGAENTP
jgi:LmbE family N-acetylglucosaminyl deacetylase